MSLAMAHGEILATDKLHALRMARKAARWRRWYRRKKKQARLAKRLAKRSPLVTGYDTLVAALVARRHQLRWTQAELDEHAGWTSTYCSKLEAWQGPQGRVATAVILSRWLEALGLGFLPVATLPGSVGEQQRALTAVRRDRLKWAEIHTRPRR